MKLSFKSEFKILSQVNTKWKKNVARKPAIAGKVESSPDRKEITYLTKLDPYKRGRSLEEE